MAENSISTPEGQWGLVQSARRRQTTCREAELKAFPLGVARCALFEVTDFQRCLPLRQRQYETQDAR